MREQDENRRPEEIEHDIQRTRAEVSSTIDAIQNKLTPGQMMDQAVAYARTSLPADFGANLANTVRDNPVPVALIGVGIAWLAMQGQQSDGRARRRRRHALEYDRADDMSGTDDSQSGKIRRAASAVSDKGRELKDKGRDLKDRASEAGHKLADTASDIGHRVGDTASSVAGRARDMTHRARDTISESRARTGELSQRSQQQYYRAKDRVSRMVDEQPLMVGALGVAIGTLLGAVLPGTRREDDLMGDTRDNLMESARQTAHEKAGTFKESAKRVAETAQREVKAAIDDNSGNRSQESAPSTAGSAAARNETVLPTHGQQSLH